MPTQRRRTVRRKRPIARRTRGRVGTNRRKFMAKNRKAFIPRLRVGYPFKMFVTLHYTERLQMQASTAGSEAHYVFRGNDPYDPYVGLNNNSAGEYQRFAQVYRYCKVVASSIRVRLSNFNGTTTQVILCPITKFPMLIGDNLKVQRFAKSSHHAKATTDSRLTLKHQMRTNTMFGIPSLKYSEYQYVIDNSITSATRTVNTPWYWAVSCEKTSDDTVNPMNMVGDVDIYYKCVFFDKYQVELFDSENTQEDPTTIFGGASDPSIQAVEFTP